MSSSLKSFFYPVLHKSSNDYVDGSYFEVEVSGRLMQKNDVENLCLDYKVNFSSPGLQKYLDNGAASIFLDVYSKETISRSVFSLKDLEGTLEFKPGLLMGLLEVQARIICSKKISGFNPSGINPEYGDIKFDVSAGSILAVGEKVLLPLSFKRVKMESIIRVQKSEDLDKDTFSVNLESNVITILMGSAFHSLWDIMRSDYSVRPYLFLSVYKDTFVEALSVLNKSEDVDEYGWAQALITKCEQNQIKLEELVDFASQNQAALKLLREFGVHKLLVNEV